MKRERRTRCLNWKMMMAWLLTAILAIGVFPASAAPLRSNTGNILQLVAIGAGSPGDPIQISSQIQATSQIQISNLLYQLFSPSGSLIDSRKIGLDPFEPGDTFSDSWTSSNPPETGNYTVSLCWSTGNAENCDIASAQTGFYSVPSLGTPLMALAAGLLVVGLYRRRALFQVAVSG